jgi:thiol-disulfide isomerase/thioredoxin
MRVPRLALALPIVALLAPLASPVGGQMIPPHATLSEFEPFGVYDLEVGGIVQREVRIFRREKGSVVLMTGPGLAAAYALVPADKAVKRLAANKIVVGPDGIAFALADAAVSRESDYTIDGSEVVFTLGGKPARLREKPYLLGLHPGRDLLQHDVSYAFMAQRYRPSPVEVRALQQTRQPVRVRVFFGSWCPHCKEIVPRILQAAKSLEGTPIKFEYYGLPLGFGPQAKSWGITEVPYVVVYRGDREIGRVRGDDLKIPERGIRKLLDAQAKASR